MKLSHHALAVSLALLAFMQTAAHAEEYEGVLRFQSSASRSSVQVQALEAARAPDPYADAVSSVVAAAPSQPRDRSAVRTEAVSQAHEPYQNLHLDAYVNSRIPAYYSMDASHGTRHALGGSQTRAH
jgi:hypothetical protein